MKPLLSESYLANSSLISLSSCISNVNPKTLKVSYLILSLDIQPKLWKLWKVYLPIAILVCLKYINYGCLILISNTCFTRALTSSLDISPPNFLISFFSSLRVTWPSPSMSSSLKASVNGNKIKNKTNTISLIYLTSFSSVLLLLLILVLFISEFE